MNTIEKIMSEYDDFDYIFHHEMPHKLHGLIDGKTIYINDHISDKQKVSAIMEEVGHYKTSSHSDITDYKTNGKDEAIARRWSYGQLIPVDHIARYQDREDAVLVYEIAEDLELPETIVESAIYMYKIKGMI
ncbi:ImmA/IrrE family metallo-endopeptidase [Aerococcus viridans]